MRKWKWMNLYPKGVQNVAEDFMDSCERNNLTIKEVHLVLKGLSSEVPERINCIAFKEGPYLSKQAEAGD